MTLSPVQWSCRRHLARQLLALPLPSAPSTGRSCFSSPSRPSSPSSSTSSATSSWRNNNSNLATMAKGMAAGPHSIKSSSMETKSRSLPSKRLVSTTSQTSSSSSASSAASAAAPPIDFSSLPHSSPEVQELIHKHAMQPQTSASLQTLMKTGRGEFLHKMSDRILPSHGDKGGTNNTNNTSSNNANDNASEATPLVLLQVAGFLRHELPIRLAHRIQDLSRVPLLAQMPSVQQVKDLYTTSFLEILSTTPKVISTFDEERNFARVLEHIYERHGSVLVQMARGAFELRAAIREGALLPGDDDGCEGEGSKLPAVEERELKAGRDAVEFELMESTHAFLDRFYISRIGIRVLIGQYLSLRQPPVESYVGIICSRTSPYEIVKRAIDDAAFMCTRKYGDAPEVIITGRLDMTFPYVPTHLHYIMLELLKNSMRATVEYHGIDADYPPIKVVIADGSDNEDVIIKVSDEGGGIPRSNMKRIWSYLFTTADPEIQEGMVAFNENVDHSIDSPLAGLGYGLPISRSYARYFGGDLSIMSMEGYGTDCFVYLTRLGNTREPLPI